MGRGAAVMNDLPQVAHNHTPPPSPLLTARYFSIECCKQADEQYAQYVSNAHGVKTQKEREAREAAAKEGGNDGDSAEGDMPQGLSPV